MDLNPAIKELAGNYGGLGIEADLSLPGQAKRVVTAGIIHWDLRKYSSTEIISVWEWFWEKC